MRGEKRGRERIKHRGVGGKGVERIRDETRIFERKTEREAKEGEK